MRIHFNYLAMTLAAALLPVSPAVAKGGGKGANKMHQNNGAKNDKKARKTPPGHAAKPGNGARSGKDDVAGELWIPGIKLDETRLLAQQNHFVGQKPLPPGIRKNLMRGKPLPPGIAKTSLPKPFVSSLPVRPGYEWRAYGTDLVLVSVASNMIAHVISNALR